LIETHPTDFHIVVFGENVTVFATLVAFLGYMDLKCEQILCFIVGCKGCPGIPGRFVHLPPEPQDEPQELLLGLSPDPQDEPQEHAVFPWVSFR